MYNEIAQFKSPAIRDLVWALLSPDLIRRWADAAWNLEQYQQTQSLLLSLDRQPEFLAEKIKPWPQVILGKYVESLWSLWLHQNPRYVLLHENLQVYHQPDETPHHRVTIGEFDYIVKDLQTDLTEHWEIAFKYFLGYGNTHHQNAWYGLKFTDRLDIKVDKLANHQTQLSKRPEAQKFISDHKLKIDKVRVIFKGMLFYPTSPENSSLPAGSNPEHLKSTWTHFDRFLREPRFQELRWAPLNKSHWLAPRLPTGDELTSEQLNTHHQNKTLDLPTAIAGFKNNQEHTRIFLVPNTWQLPPSTKADK